MTTLGYPSPSSSPPLQRRSKGCARKCERYCWTTLIYSPLLFVYGLTTWAIWVEITLGFNLSNKSWTGYISSFIGIILYSLLNWSYTVAVFVDPGSPLTSSNGYSHLPTQEPRNPSSFTVKSTGGSRFCKKCQARKPDRAHHCSTCKRCVLKMDHHCPWLAGCVGLHNYKPFLLFLIYTTLFCWICFAVSSGWAWTAILSDGNFDGQEIMPVNYVLLTVISGIIGLVLTGFTAWHMSLAWRGQTTIECLEKTRYLSPLRKSMQQQHYQQNYVNGGDAPSYGQQLRDIHANVLPGVTRPEEGEERSSPTVNNSRAEYLLHRTYNDFERSRERHRYEDYLDEQDSEKLPNAFDLGWRRNMTHLFGEKPVLWFFPICNTTGDGWQWEASPKWIDAREEIRRERGGQWRDQHINHNDDGWEDGTVRRYPPSSFQPSEERERHYFSTEDDSSFGASDRRTLRNEDDARSLYVNPYSDGQQSSTEPPHSGMSLKTLHSSRNANEGGDDDHYEVSSDEEEPDQRALSRHEGGGWGRQKVTGSDKGQGKRLLKGQERVDDEWHDWGVSGDHEDRADQRREW
ncbi:MAG: hypothetical protein M1812_005410 [Candelaria pacifica]|nr:MAG: hypothetical protein M1812_005410 [Candelaria pacifica]